MKAIVIEQYGGKEQLTEKEVPTPAPGDDQILIEIYATSINPIDWKLREGYLKEMLRFEFPIILGWDTAGIVKEVGSKDSNFKVGDKVFSRPATTNRGTYAEYVVADESLVAKMPDNLDFGEAASVPLTGLTAWQCLFDFGEIKEGDKVLIHAGAGGVGTMAIQLAKNAGAYVATTASVKNIEFLKSIGADEVVNYKTTDFEDVLQDYDFVLDALGGEIQKKSFNVLKEGGRLASIVSRPDEETADEKGVKAGFVWLEPNGEQLGQLGKLIEQGQVKTHVGHTFDFSEEGLRKAHEISESHHAKGKIVINIKR
ncbi:NADP-dependent oxidoreductase [Alkalihalobacillus sp. AL-G]|uniref:NADP-dependent oxidoreductase n=1 Tax=Alkalihalobacillus sp. AL-G TaxID=2926399 RepID=UPI0027295E30|nr:NADP-dependent oxidoreductase [Alkalihalobacillus sp. AL-G]WLD95348.1 NADP-dependent oxidoreductase [Alkalihalobacillus sp. AL-G]